MKFNNFEIFDHNLWVHAQVCSVEGVMQSGDDTQRCVVSLNEA